MLFEEAWASLLAVLGYSLQGSQEGLESFVVGVEESESISLAIAGLTTLILQTLRLKQPGEHASHTLLSIITLRVFPTLIHSSI